MNATGLGLGIVRVQGNKIIFVTHLLTKLPQKTLQSHEMTFLNNIPVEFGRWVESWSHVVHVSRRGGYIVESSNVDGTSILHLGARDAGGGGCRCVV